MVTKNAAAGIDFEPDCSLTQSSAPQKSNGHTILCKNCERHTLRFQDAVRDNSANGREWNPFCRWKRCDPQDSFDASRSAGPNTAAGWLRLFTIGAVDRKFGRAGRNKDSLLSLDSKNSNHLHYETGVQQ